MVSLILYFGEKTQPKHQFIPLLLISSEDVSIHIHAGLKTQSGSIFLAYIYHITLDDIRPANTILPNISHT